MLVNLITDDVRDGIAKCVLDKDVRSLARGGILQTSIV